MTRHWTQRSPDVIAAIRAEARRGVKQAALARRYRLSQSSISRIVTRKSWASDIRGEQ